MKKDKRKKSNNTENYINFKQTLNEYYKKNSNTF